jgi:hypothetical protein
VYGGVFGGACRVDLAIVFPFWELVVGAIFQKVDYLKDFN